MCAVACAKVFGPLTRVWGAPIWRVPGRVSGVSARDRERSGRFRSAPMAWGGAIGPLGAPVWGAGVLWTRESGSGASLDARDDSGGFGRGRASCARAARGVARRVSAVARGVASDRVAGRVREDRPRRPAAGGGSVQGRLCVSVCVLSEWSRPGVWDVSRRGMGAWMVPARGGCVEHEKGIRWMPWHQEATKDVARCEKPRGAASGR